MPRLIDADALLEKVQFRLPIDNHNAEVISGCVGISRRLIETAPTIDAVPVVRCAKCEWYREDGGICVNPKCGKSWYGCRVPEQHFCSYGERRNDD